MFTQKLKIPMRYEPGTTFDTSGVLFYQDGGCMPLGRVVSIVPGLYKEKLCSLSKDRVTEWVSFTYNNTTYVTSMKVYTLMDLNDGKNIFCDKYLFTKAIESLLYDSGMSDSCELMSSQMFKLENTISEYPQFASDEEEIFFNFDKRAYIDSKIEEKLLTKNPYPILPVARDLIFKKNVDADILADNPDERFYEQTYPAEAIEVAVNEITVPIKGYLAAAPITERRIVGELSPFQTQPKIMEYIRSRVNENLTPFMKFKCPFSKDEMNEGIVTNDVLYSVISDFDEYPYNYYCVEYTSDEKYRTVYRGNTYFGCYKENEASVDWKIKCALQYLGKWFNSPFKKVSVCRTPTEELFISFTTSNGTTFNFYVDIAVFDLAAHNLINA